MTQLCIDYASTDDQLHTPNFGEAKAAGARMIIVRAIFGRGGPGNTPYRDPYWARDKQAILDAGMNRSAYLFLCMPRSGYVTPSATDQGHAFIDYVGHDLSPSNKLNFVPMLDVEEQSSLAPNEYYDWVVECAEVLHNFYGAYPTIYTARHIWAEYLGDHAAGVLGNCPPPWIAKPWPWPTRMPGHMDGAPGYQPYTVPAFGDSTMWSNYQYQGDATKVPGFSATNGICDLSRCNMIGEGAHGSIVKWIQARVGAVVDSDFGPKTKECVQATQAKHGLTPDGVCGVSTMSVLSWLSP